MFKIGYHPKAFLASKRNIRPGLLTRTRIVSILEKKTSNANKLAQETSLSYSNVIHHLHLLEAENILTRRGNRPYIWELTGTGQQRLTNAAAQDFVLAGGQ